MATDFSFDIVSDFDRQELVNAVDQTVREIKSRYDLKGTNSEVTLEEKTITITTDSEMTLGSIQDLLQTKAAKRGLSLKVFDFGEAEKAGGNRLRQVVTLKKGVPSDLAKQITKLIRDNLKKVQPTIQGDAVRVSAKSKDDLQTVIQLLKNEDFPVALQFTNYR
ncbi:YajQ family cyclic di-GMP-binding protein [Anthocerotibacter panamensis]|uniref:YajQ family cyclic di-GMP-binding protein n=1 Tax=Anthocerotibacter panamensis TaxID=2857077 RepID=UPI001C404004|nr:YajQ family cyclic di-GMP-binding protein [Anthocerotibacter panamensis]